MADLVLLPDALYDSLAPSIIDGGGESGEFRHWSIPGAAGEAGQVVVSSGSEPESRWALRLGSALMSALGDELPCAPHHLVEGASTHLVRTPDPVAALSVDVLAEQAATGAAGLGGHYRMEAGWEVRYKLLADVAELLGIGAAAAGHLAFHKAAGGELVPLPFRGYRASDLRRAFTSPHASAGRSPPSPLAAKVATAALHALGDEEQALLGAAIERPLLRL